MKDSNQRQLSEESILQECWSKITLTLIVAVVVIFLPCLAFYLFFGWRSKREKKRIEENEKQENPQCTYQMAVAPRSGSRDISNQVRLSLENILVWWDGGAPHFSHTLLKIKYSPIQPSTHARSSIEVEFFPSFAVQYRKRKNL